MQKILLFILVISCTNVFSQKNRYEAQFKEIAEVSVKSEAIKKLDELNKTKKFNQTEKIKFFDLYIPLAIENQNYDLALKSVFEALNYAKQIKNDSLVTNYMNQLGGTYYYINKKDEALKYFQQAANLAHKNKNWSLEAMTLSNIGAISIEIQKYDIAEKSLKTAISIFKKHKIDKSKGLLTYRLLATLYTQKKDYNLAEPIYLEIIKLSKEIKDTVMISSALVYYGEFLSTQNKIEQAIQKCDEALSYKSKDKSTYYNVISLKASYLEVASKNKEANAIYKEMLLLNREMFQENLGKSIADTEVKYKTLEIKRQKELAEAKTLAERSKNEFYIFIFVGILFLLIIIFLLIYFKQVSKRKKIELALQKQHLEAVLEAQEKEKVRIARDLHDGICQKFAATKMRFNALSSDLLDSIPEIQSNYKNCINLLDEATNELRSIAHEIMPPALSELGLVEALRQLSNNSFYNQLQFTFEVFGEQISFTQSDEINIYRIAQELFANVLKHSKATEVSIQIIFSKKQFSLFIEDNGTGFISKAKTGMGLSNIKLRSDIIKAKFNIEPGANGGTFVSVVKSELAN